MHVTCRKLPISLHMSFNSIFNQTFSNFPLKLTKPNRSTPLHSMATRPPNFFNDTQTRPPLRPIHFSYVPSFLRKLLQPHVPNSTQLMGFLTFVISGGILLLLTGVTITAVILGLIFFTPLILITCPIWIPLFIAAVGFLSLCGFGALALGGVTWVYKYFSTRRSMVDDDDSTDSADVKDYYAREFGGYLEGKVKDTAPGA